MQAFTRSCRDDPVEMMRALRCTGSEDDAGTAVARERLRALRVQAHDRTGRWVPWEQPRDDRLPWGLALGCVVVAVVLGLVVVGGVTTVRWVAGMW